ncbi:MAG TPA: LysR family transcriptional regulator [Ktedonobacteraceae bacterium]|nr:LysR family transcriptional regulator [Ktedonobacteraceae bacterium]
MDLRHLQTFKVIAETGSFVQDAERLQYAQSTLTLQIQQLEAELGVELFDRQRRKIQLTAAAHTLLIHTQHVLNQVEQMQHDLSDLAAGESGTLRVGMIEPIAHLYLMQVMCTFRERYPRIRLTIEILSTNRTHEQLIANQIDLGISTPPPANVGLIFEPILTETPVLLLPKNHPLLQQDKILLSDLCAECLLLTDPPCAYRMAIEQAFMARGFPLAIGIEIGSLEIIKQAVQQGMGVAIWKIQTIQPDHGRGGRGIVVLMPHPSRCEQKIAWLHRQLFAIHRRAGSMSGENKTDRLHAVPMREQRLAGQKGLNTSEKGIRRPHLPTRRVDQSEHTTMDPSAGTKCQESAAMRLRSCHRQRYGRVWGCGTRGTCSGPTFHNPMR